MSHRAASGSAVHPHLARALLALAVAVLPCTLAAQAAPTARSGDEARFRFTLAAGPSTAYRGYVPASLSGGVAGENLTGAGNEGVNLMLGLARPVGRALVLRIEGGYNRMTSPPATYVPLDSARVARAALSDETLSLGMALQVRLREDRSRWAPYLIAGAGAYGGRLGTNPDPDARAVTERRHLLRAGINYGVGVDLPMQESRLLRGAFAEVRLQRMLGGAHGSDFVPIAFGIRF